MMLNTWVGYVGDVELTYVQRPKHGLTKKCVEAKEIAHCHGEAVLMNTHVKDHSDVLHL